MGSFLHTLWHTQQNPMTTRTVSKIPFALLLLCLHMFGQRAHAQWGTPLWTNRYNGPVNSSDVANAMAVDTNDNVFVTGYTTVGGGGVYYATLAYTGTGTPLWTSLYTGPVGGNEAVAIATDNHGHVFVTGESLDPLGPYDFATVAYSSAGTPLWTNRFNTPPSPPSDAHPAGVAADSTGNVFVTGFAYYSDGSGSYYATLAYSPGGATLWTNTFRGPGTAPWFGDAATALAVDTNGNVLVTGTSGTGATGVNIYNYATIKYSNAGAGLWTNFYSGPTNADNRPLAMAVAVSGNTFVTGRSIGANGAYEYATIAYSAAGTPLWTNRYGSAGGDDEAGAIALDTNGNVFVTGTSKDTNGYNDSLTVAYSGAGVPLWTNRFLQHYGQKSIAVDNIGNVFVTGGNYITVAYSGAGALLWTNQYPGLDFNNGAANAIVADQSGNLFVTGGSFATNGAPDYVTIKYSPTTVPPYLSIQLISNQAVLSWTNPAFSLQVMSAGVFTNIAGATSPYTNSVTHQKQFFRLALY
jgi:hypothetical protein